MKKTITTLIIIAIAIVGIIILKNSSETSSFLWNLSNKGAWLFPLVLVSALLDSVHPCSFSILLITIAILFGMQMSRKKILTIGGAYIFGIFAAYLLIGLGILQVLHLFNTPHFMGKLGAIVLVLFGLLNIVNYLFPEFPVKLRLPQGIHSSVSKLIDKASLPAAFGLGTLVGICQFPCMGGPYLMVIGLLRDQVTYFKGLGYLFLYNLILIIPLVAVLTISADKLLVDKMQQWQQQKRTSIKLVGGIIMIILGLIIYLI